VTEALKQAKAAAKAEAHLYVWGVVVDILEGSATPGRSDARGASAVDRVIKIARKEQARLLAAHDAALTHLSKQQAREIIDSQSDAGTGVES
jgi:hypothetical protein